METKQLIELAKEARKLSYSPYSNFAVGAVILTKDGKIFKVIKYKTMTMIEMHQGTCFLTRCV